MAELDLLTKFNRGLCLSLVEEKPFEALQTYRQYIAYLKANDSNELFKEELIKIRKDFFDKMLSFVLSHKNQNKLSDLIAVYQGLLAEFPNNAKIYRHCSTVFRQLEQYDIELELLLKANENEPDNITTYDELYYAYTDNGDYENAAKCAKYLIEAEPKNPHNYYLLGRAYISIYERSGNENYLTNAIVNLEIACKMDNRIMEYPRTLAVAYTKARNKEKLESVWNEIMQRPDVGYNDKFIYSTYLIRYGNLTKGFEMYEARLKSSYYENPIITDAPIYNGFDDISDKWLLVQAEQGIGDTFLFSRFVNSLKGKAKRIFLRVQESAYSVIKRSFPDFEVLPYGALIEADYYIPLMSIPHLLGITKDNIPTRKDYLISNKEKNERFKKELFNNDKFKIGIAYKGKEDKLKARDIPLKEFIPLTKMDNVEVYSLQYGEEDEVYEGTGIINLAGKIKSFDDTASLIENMDLIITGDNVTLNLAGGLGKKTFGVFNYLPEFRWFDLTGDDVKWYETVKPYQAEKLGDWAPVIAKVVEDVKKLVQK